jgi:hypothetical protein
MPVGENNLPLKKKMSCCCRQSTAQLVTPHSWTVFLTHREEYSQTLNLLLNGRSNAIVLLTAEQAGLSKILWLISSFIT